MKVKLIVLSFMLTFLCELNAQNDAFFIDAPVRNENDSGLDFGNMSNGNGFSFGIFGDENGFNFGMIDENEGFNFNIFGDEDNGFDFGNFDFESDETEEIPLGNGLLLLTAASLVYLRRKDSEMQR